MRTTETLPNGFKLIQEDGVLRVTLDACAIARETALRVAKGARTADIGAGAGAITTLLCAMRDDVRVSAFEMDDHAFRLLAENIGANNLEGRVTAVRGDVRLTATAHKGEFDAAVTNPPYRDTCGENAERDTSALPPDQLAAASALLLRHHGRLFCVVSAARLLDYCAAFSVAGLEPKRLTFVAADKKPTLVLIEAVAGAKRGLVIEPTISPKDIESFFAV